MKDILFWLAGYRKYTFVLFTGKVIRFWSKNKSQAIQKALNMERQIRAKREQIHFIQGQETPECRPKKHLA